MKATILNSTDSEGAPTPSPMINEEIFLANESYACTECKSEIEILSLDNEKIKMTFKCLNNNIQNNHGIQTFPIRTYINKMKNNTYIYDICSICKNIQVNSKNKIIFNFCTKCEEIICDKCKEEHVKDNKYHYFIKNNQKPVLCHKHPNNKNIEYCLKCKSNLCIECLKSGEHAGHRKNNLLEVKPSEEEINIIVNYIDSLRNKKKDLEEAKEKKKIELYNKLIINKKKVHSNLNKYIKLQKSIFKKKVDLNTKKLVNELTLLKKEYENKIKLKMDIFKQLVKNGEHKYKLLIENYTINFYKNKINKIDIKYSNDYKNFTTFYDNQINDIKDLLNINEIIKNCHEKYEDNYYNNINFSAILCSTGKYTRNMQQKLKQELEDEENIISENERLKKENNELQTSLHKYDKINVNEVNKTIESNKILNESNLNLKKENEQLKKEKNDLNMNYKDLDLKYNDLNSKYNNLLIQCNELNKQLEQIKRLSSIEFPKEYKNLPKAYSKYCFNNLFCVFKSITDLNILVYATKEKSIQFFDLSQEKQIHEIINAHNSFITNLRYYFDDKKKRDLILSICIDSREIKIWDNNKYECLLKISNIYKKGEIHSACFFNYNNEVYIALSNFHPYNSYPIYIYDINGKKIKNLSQSNDKINFVDSFYYIEKNTNNKITYIITANEDSIRSFNYNKDSLYHKYYDKDDNGHYSFIINEKDLIIQLIESSKNGYIRIWNFDSGELISKINLKCNGLYDICEWEDDLIFIGSENQKIILLDLIHGEIKAKLDSNNQVSCVKTISHPLFGRCLISQGKGSDNIKLWHT